MTPNASQLPSPEDAVAANPEQLQEFSLYLRRDPAHEKSWAEAVYQANREDWQNRAFLEGAEIARLCSPADADRQRAIAFAATHGLTVKSSSPADRHVLLEGTVAQIEHALGLNSGGLGLKAYQRNGTTLLTHAVDPDPPAELADCVVGVPIVRPQQMKSRVARLSPARESLLRKVQAGETKMAARTAAPASKNARQWADFYGSTQASGQPMPASNPARATQQAIAIVGYEGGYSVSDLTAGCKAMGVPVPDMEDRFVDGATNDYTGNPQSADLEWSLDQTCIAGTAVGAKIYNYFSPNNNVSSAKLHQQIATDNLVSIISESWGDTFGNYTAADRTAMHDALEACTVAGIAFFNSAGDDGDRGVNGTTKTPNPAPTPDYPACDPETTPVGATFEPGPTPAQGQVWNRLKQNEGATGCGLAPPGTYTTPSYLATVAPGNQRPYNEIGADGDPESGCEVPLGGNFIVVGGTSESCPLVAGSYAVVSQAVADATGKPNQRLGKPGAIFASLAGTGAFYVTRSGTTEDYPAAQAGETYCLPTGFGTPNVAEMARLIVAQQATATGPSLAA